MRRTIAVNAQTHADVKTLSKTLNMELGEFVKHSAVYFKKTGIDPSKSENESPHKVMKELVTRVGQVVAYIKTHEQEKLNPLLDQLIILTRKLDEALNILPKSERFDQVIKGVNHHANLQVDNHKKQMDFLRQSQQKINDESKQELTALTKAIGSLQVEQKAIKEVIETKLKSKLF
jgi:hypothetical protein